jgi:hypothetical protein
VLFSPQCLLLRPKSGINLGAFNRKYSEIAAFINFGSQVALANQAKREQTRDLLPSELDFCHGKCRGRSSSTGLVVPSKMLVLLHT